MSSIAKCNRIHLFLKNMLNFFVCFRLEQLILNKTEEQLEGGLNENTLECFCVNKFSANG